MRTSKLLVVSCKHVQHFHVIETTACAIHDYIRGFIAEGLDSLQGLSEYGANEKSAVGGSPATSNDGGNSNGLGQSSS